MSAERSARNALTENAICCIFALRTTLIWLATRQGANDIVMQLRAGPLPARLTTVEESPMAAPM
ncbi:MAG: hypothetical protein EOR30_06855 [Mesorhizobium sp.]|uniref:hypothetical protein n=1 Tax=Mesorhizobium sp. TaxID=1871066 RepID=UPI000FE6FD82|nr:hypothetical protein [Mesorhizobium sp.]RWF83028.1 MAG: hypothetical protein EOQ36_28105 [Mesorhizobium sp.]RWF91848.1 MAG: hypothetical protein EOQ45_23955 [Mesorhizobium sp.]RWI43047.1 MAG: hypothetical protein EOR14_00055 [Mesorhizobium sp.]RWI62663.1 MAG: hypothetical protein EOR17_31810 [Mesorhizobium sp.]RWJ11213.1 MAG: hypothetical protein EOR25_31660 [Mesorhizobium sp.]